MRPLVPTCEPVLTEAMSLADACLVRLSEIHSAAEVFTLDSDFRIYRRHGNKVIPVLTPD